ncbi:DUF3995 domain-containing protein [Nocardia sp. NPDC058705]|uniref:DUF3995 domain-containing protein n=1 Tax=Nocardia sp. NPDC058705 TaxID=3346609 RepID=UPI00367A0CAE
MNAIAGTTAALLTAAGLLHAVWTVSPWPWKTQLDLAHAAMGWTKDEPPPSRWFIPACLAVTAALTTAGYVVLLRAGVWDSPFPDWMVTTASWIVAGILLARAASGFIDPTSGSPESPAIYQRLNRRVYSPLCVLLGGLTAVVAVS